MTGPIAPAGGFARVYLGATADRNVGVIHLESACRAIQAARLAPVPVPGGEAPAPPPEGGGLLVVPEGGGVPVVPDLIPDPPGVDVPDAPDLEAPDPAIPLPPGPDDVVVAPPVAPVVPTTQVVQADLAAIAGVRADPPRRATVVGPTLYSINQRGVSGVALEWAVATATDDMLLWALNEYLRHRLPASTEETVVFRDPPPAPIAPPLPGPVQDPPLVPDAVGPVYGARAVSPNFEFWVNHVFTEVSSHDVKNSIRRLLSGHNGAVVPAPSYRWLPDSGDERLARQTERGGWDGISARHWLDDVEAVAVMDLLVRYAYQDMPLVEAARDTLLPLIGPNTDGLPETLGIGFNASARTPDQTRASHGASPRTAWAYPGVPDAAWRPFSPTQGRHTQKFYRMGNGDNELETTVSVAQRAHESVDFPLVQQVIYDVDDLRPHRYNPLPAGNHVTVRVSDQHVPTTETWLYVMLVDHIYSTRALQVSTGASAFRSITSEAVPAGTFPGENELATDVVPWDRMLAALRYERVHAGTSRESGMRYRLVEVRDFLGDAVSWGGDADTSLFRRFYAQILHRMPVCGVKFGTYLNDGLQRVLLAASALATPPAPAAAALLTTVSARLAALPPQVGRNEADIARAALLTAVLDDAQTWLHGAGQGAMGAWASGIDRMTRMGAGTLPLPRLAAA